ncbi:MAG TPA: hypothetical protein VMP68_01685, partial [Candidatus Eisenbacteria bacterium]|nr:hypothetical protein [Candidatus Eisenbacteria bacterium]
YHSSTHEEAKKRCTLVTSGFASPERYNLGSAEFYGHDGMEIGGRAAANVGCDNATRQTGTSMAAKRSGGSFGFRYGNSVRQRCVGYCNPG